jgi:Transposase IS116/IS110/IS902 family
LLPTFDSGEDAAWRRDPHEDRRWSIGSPGWCDREPGFGSSRRRLRLPGVGPIVALAYIAAIEDINRFRRMRRVRAYLGLTTRRYQSSETDVVLGISRQGDAMARHFFYEAANVLLTTVRRPSARNSWGLKLMKRRGPKRARVAVARRLAILLGRIRKDSTRGLPRTRGRRRPRAAGLQHRSYAASPR